MTFLIRRYDTCPVEVTPDSTPCGRPATGWAWYDGGDHESVLMQVCARHETSSGLAIAALMVERDRLRRLLGSHVDGHCCSCEMTDPGIPGVSPSETEVRTTRTYTLHLHGKVIDPDQLAALLRRAKADPLAGNGSLRVETDVQGVHISITTVRKDSIGHLGATP